MPRWLPRLLRRIHELAGRGQVRFTLFKPSVAGTTVYLKLILRAECLVVSFHEDEGESDEEQS